MAVGSDSNGTNDLALEQKWNGTSWATVSSSSSQSADLNDVSCVSASFCMEVGSYFNGTASQSLSEKWNGSKWAKVTAADTSPTASNDLSWVSCPSATFCMAVGSHSGTGPGQTLAQKWNGTRWTLVTSPDKGTGNNELNGVSCTSSAFCMGAGDFTAASLDRTLIEK
jgi:hypothetical protein